MVETEREAVRRWPRGMGGWLFLTAVAAAYVAAGLVDAAVVQTALAALGPLALRIVPILILVFGLLFLAELFVDRTWLAALLTRGRGLSGWILAIGCGVLSVGPLYAWYPLLADLYAKGVGRGLLAAFLYSRALKLPLLPMMLLYFGLRYTVLLSLAIIFFALINGLLTGWLSRGGAIVRPRPPA